MAKADDTIPDPILLRAARDLAAERLGSKAGAEEQLLEWMAAGKLPWIAKRWKAPDAAEIAELNRILAIGDSDSQFTAYYNGDPRFVAEAPDVDWEDNTMREVTYQREGVVAQGIVVSRARLDELLDELLPPVPREREESPEPTQTVEKKGPEDWLAWARKEKYPRQRNEKTEDYIKRLHGLMQNADNVTEVWEYGTFRRRYFAQVKAEQS